MSSPAERVAKIMGIPPDAVWPDEPPLTEDDQIDAELEERLEFRRDVNEEARRLRVREAAARLVRQERASALVEPSLVRLDDFLAVKDEPELYRVDRLWPAGGRVVLAAQYKAGKTTLRDNLVRALVDGDPFLEAFTVHPPEGRVVVIDNELDPRMLRRWMREQGIVNTERVVVLPLRGKVGTFDLLDDDCRARWAKRLAEVEASVVILDCLRPVLDALGLSEDKDAGRFLVAFDALLAESGAGESVVTHHMGHTGERSRGDTRIRDWPDVEWQLLREKAEEGAEQLAEARRYFKAYGRDVDQAEGLLEYDHESRRLQLTGGTRKETASDKALPDLLAYLADNPGASGRAIELALKDEHRREMVRTAIRRAVAAGFVQTTDGPKRAVLHFLSTPSAPSAPEVRQRAGVECASAPIGGARAHTPQSEESSAPSRTHAEVLGSCAVCYAPTDRYGEHGHPLCHRCRTAAGSGPEGQELPV